MNGILWNLNVGIRAVTNWITHCLRCDVIMSKGVQEQYIPRSNYIWAPSKSTMLHSTLLTGTL